MARRKQPTLRQTVYAGFTPLGNGSIGQRASAEAQLRYAPQIESLLMLLAQRRQQQHGDVQQVRRGGLAAAGGIRQVRAGLQQQLADTPAPTSEAAAHLGLTRDAVSGALAQMQAQQYAGINAGIANARRSSRSDQVSILGQLQQAAQQGGLYNVSEFNSLSDANRKFKAQQQQANRTLMAGLAKAGLGPDGRPIPGIFNKIHPGKTPHAPVDGIDYQTYLQMSPAQRRAAHKLYAESGRKPGGSGSGGAKAPSASDRRTADKAIGTIGRIADFLPKIHATTIYYNPATGHTLTPDANGKYPKWARKRALTHGEIMAAINKQFGESASPAIIHAANQIAHGGIQHHTIRKLRKMYPGLKLPHGWVVGHQPKHRHKVTPPNLSGTVLGPVQRVG